jgi:hypothetical protein
MELSENFIKLVGYLAWPVTTIFACIVFYGPLSRLVETLGRRITKFSIFKVDIELDRLTKAVSLGATVESLRKVAVTESGIAPIVAGVVKSGSADYLVVNIGDDGDDWLTSRLFLLAAILERSRAVKCVVFLDKAECFVGAATARDIRSSIGAHYLAYEAAFVSAYGPLPLDQNMFRSGLNEILINRLSNGFLKSTLVSRTNMPAPESGWVKLQREAPSPPTWEFADWVTAASLKDLLGQHLLTESIVADVGRVSPQTTKSLMKLSGPLVAVVSSNGVFKAICDRHAAVENVARQAAEQSADP